MGLFAQEIARYLDCFDAGLTLTDFAEIDSTGRPAPEHRGLFYRILRLEPVNPRRRTWQEIVARLQAIYDQASKVETPGPATRRQDLREKLAQADIKFLDHSNGQCRVSPVALRELYDTCLLYTSPSPRD